MTAVSEQIGYWVDQFTRQQAAAPWLQTPEEYARRMRELVA